MLWQLMAIHEIKKAARELDAQQKAYEKEILRDEQTLYGNRNSDYSTPHMKEPSHEVKQTPPPSSVSTDSGSNSNWGCWIVIILIVLVIVGVKACDYYRENNKEPQIEPVTTCATYKDTIAADTSVTAKHIEEKVTTTKSTSIPRSSYSYSSSYSSYDDDNEYDEEGYDRNGYDRDGYDRDGYDEDGYDEDGLDEEGRPEEVDW